MILRRNTESTSARALNADRRHDVSISSIVERVIEIANKRGVTAAQVTLARLLNNPESPLPLLGVSSSEQPSQALGAIQVALEPSEEEYLTLYRPTQLAT